MSENNINYHKLPSPFSESNVYLVEKREFDSLLSNVVFCPTMLKKTDFWNGNWLTNFPSTSDKHKESKNCSEVYLNSTKNAELVIYTVVKSMFPKLELLNVAEDVCEYIPSSVLKWIYYKYIEYCKINYVFSYSDILQKPIKHLDTDFEVLCKVKKDEVDFKKNMEDMYSKSVTFVNTMEACSVGELLEALLLRVIRTVNKTEGKIILRKITSGEDNSCLSICSQELEDPDSGELIFIFSHPIAWYLLDYAKEFNLDINDDEINIHLSQMGELSSKLNLSHITIYTTSILTKALKVTGNALLYPNWVDNSEEVKNIQAIYKKVPSIMEAPMTSIYDGYFIALLPVIMVFQSNIDSQNVYNQNVDAIINVSVDIRVESKVCPKCEIVLDKLILRCLGKDFEEYRGKMKEKLLKIVECKSIIRGHCLTINLAEAFIKDNRNRDISLISSMGKYLNPTKIVLLCRDNNTLITYHNHGKFKGVGLFSNAVTLFHPLTMYSNLIISTNNIDELREISMQSEYCILSRDQVIEYTQSLNKSSPLLQAVLAYEDIEEIFEFLVGNYITLVLDPLVLYKRAELMDRIKIKINEKMQIHKYNDYNEYKNTLMTYFRNVISNNGLNKSDDHGKAFELWKKHVSSIEANDVSRLCTLFVDQFTADFNSIVWRRTCRYVQGKPFCSKCKKNYDYQLPVAMCEVLCSNKKPTNATFVRNGIGTRDISPKFFC